jgi:hypothetical protein
MCYNDHYSISLGTAFLLKVDRTCIKSVSTDRGIKLSRSFVDVSLLGRISTVLVKGHVFDFSVLAAHALSVILHELSLPGLQIPDSSALGICALPIRTGNAGT